MEHRGNSALCCCNGSDRYDSYEEVLWGIYYCCVTCRASPNLLSDNCLFFIDLSPGNHHLYMWECPHQHFTQHTGMKCRTPAIQQTLSTQQACYTCKDSFCSLFTKLYMHSSEL